MNCLSGVRSLYLHESSSGGSWRQRVYGSGSNDSSSSGRQKEYTTRAASATRLTAIPSLSTSPVVSRHVVRPSPDPPRPAPSRPDASPRFVTRSGVDLHSRSSDSQDPPSHIPLDTQLRITTSSSRSSDSTKAGPRLSPLNPSKSVQQASPKSAQQPSPKSDQHLSPKSGQSGTFQYPSSPVQKSPVQPPSPGNKLSPMSQKSSETTFILATPSVSSGKPGKILADRTRKSSDSNSSEPTTSATIVLTPRIKSGPAQRKATSSGRAKTPESERDDRSFVSASAKTTGSGTMSRSESFESVLSIGTIETKSMVTAGGTASRRSGSASTASFSDANDSRSSTPTTEGSTSRSASLKLIKKQLGTMERKCAQLESENSQLRTDAYVHSNFKHDDSNLKNLTVAQLRAKLAEAEQVANDYKEENSVLKNQLRELQEGEGLGDVKDLKQKLNAAETLCEEMLEENEALKSEVRELQTEIEELQDQYREEEIEEFRELQRELEQTAKNCRVLQFKLRKAERRSDQTEADRQHLQDKVRELMANPSSVSDGSSDNRKIKELQSELKIAKEVSVRLHNELEALDEKRGKLEENNFYLKEKIRELEMREHQFEKMKHHYEQKRPSSKTRRDSSGSTADEKEYDVQQLLRDIRDSNERETDLKEQLKFAEQDVKNLRAKLRDLEMENDGLNQQLSKHTHAVYTPRARGSPKRDADNKTHQIQLELAEHEASVLKQKLTKEEQQNELLNSKVSLLEREFREKTGKPVEFSEAEIRAAIPDTYYKQKIKILEEEIEELKSTIATGIRPITGGAGKLSDFAMRRAVRMGRSRSLESYEQQEAGAGQSLDLKRQLVMIEQECDVLRQRIDFLEKDNDQLQQENKMLQLRPRGPVVKSRSTESMGVPANKDVEQMEADIHRFIEKINTLERENKELLGKLAKKLPGEVIANGHFDPDTASVSEVREKCRKLLAEKRQYLTDQKAERERIKALEAQTADFKSMVAQSDNQKLILMASKVEVLSNQLKSANDRLNSFHKRMGKNQDAKENYSATCRGGKPAAVQRIPENISGGKDMLKERVEQLERELAEEKSKKLYPTGQANGDANQNSDHLKSSLGYIRFEVADFETLKKKIKSLKLPPDETVTSAPGTGDSANTEKLKEELSEALTAKSKAQFDTQAATDRLLQAEHRWSSDLRKSKESYESELTGLKAKLSDLERALDDKAHALKQAESSLKDKTKRTKELETDLAAVQAELQSRFKNLESELDSERKKASDFQRKHQKLEELYEQDRSKFASEKERSKTELNEFKKKREQDSQDFERREKQLSRRVKELTSEKAEMESKNKKLQDEISEVEKKAAKRAEDMASVENRKLISEIGVLQRKVEADREEHTREKENLHSVIDQKTRDAQFRGEDVERMKKEVATLKARIEDQKSQLEETRRARDDSREELTRSQQSWNRDRSELTHKLRQEAKVQQAEQQAMQMKFESRIRVMEDSAKRIQTQLTQIRHERDQLRDQLSSVEKKHTELRQKSEAEEAELQSKLIRLQEENEQVDDLKAQLTQVNLELDTLKAMSEKDKEIWELERGRLHGAMTNQPVSENQKLLDSSLNATKELRQQITDVKSKYDLELKKLKKNTEKGKSEWIKEKSDLHKRLRELQEQVKVLEIDRQNLLSRKDEGESARGALVAEKDELLARIHDGEIHQLANKYKLDKVADGMNDLLAKIRYEDSGEKAELSTVLDKAMAQLLEVQNDMAKTKELGKALDTRASEETWRQISTTVVRDSPPVPEEPTPSTSSTAAPPPSSSASTHYVSDGKSFSATGPEVVVMRLRSPSPNPRKITNYPQAPPSFILDKSGIASKGIEYDDHGRLHWARRSQLRRSASHDPTPALMASLTENKSGFLAATAETGSMNGLAEGSSLADSESGAVPAGNDLVPATAVSSTEQRPVQPPVKVKTIKVKSGSGSKVSQMIEKFGSLKRSDAKRSAFATGKSSSVDSHDVKHVIGGMGMQAMVPGASSDALEQVSPRTNRPLFKQSSTESVDSTKLKVTGAKFMHKFRRSVDRSEEDLHAHEVKKSSSSISISNMMRPFRAKSRDPPELPYTPFLDSRWSSVRSLRSRRPRNYVDRFSRLP